MALGKLGPLDLDLCLACAGIWFDTGELSRLISAGPDVVLRLAERLHSSTLRPNVRSLGGPSCPACRSALESTDYGALRGVSVDACRWCEGVWITRTSLTRLSVALRGASEWQVLAMEQPGGASAGTPPPTAPQMAPQPPPPAMAQPLGRSPLQPTPPPQPPAHPGATRVAPRLVEAPTSARPGMLGCPKCGEPNSDRAAVCWACGAAFQGPVVGKCPQCLAAMRRVSAADVAFSACEGCGGVCITPNRLNQIIRMPTGVQDQMLLQVGRVNAQLCKSQVAAVECPQCSTAMIRAPLGVLSTQPVHTCTRCFGLFLQPGMFKNIVSRHR